MKAEYGAGWGYAIVVSNIPKLNNSERFATKQLHTEICSDVYEVSGTEVFRLKIISRTQIFEMDLRLQEMRVILATHGERSILYFIVWSLEGVSKMCSDDGNEVLWPEELTTINSQLNALIHNRGIPRAVSEDKNRKNSPGEIRQVLQVG